jgi:formimidoylglutamate deiminase
MAGDARRFFAARAWVAGGWADDVLLEVGPDGRWLTVRPDCPAARVGAAERLDGPVLPGLVDAHSHAFQRAIAGLTERSGASQDDFWRWRDRMYAVALRISPAQLEAIAAQLYGELLAAGYTHVCEFHYLHNDLDGRPYADASELSLALVRAAQRVGIGLTLLPTLYMRSGFAAAGLREDQRRFSSTPESVLRIAEGVRRQAVEDPTITAGVALHSLRAVDATALGETAQAAGAQGLPVHIHIAEQLRHAKVDARWNLVHATQASPDELAALRAHGGSVVICPSTEANLGDGVFDLPAWMGASGRWSIGSDSHVTRSWQEELRLLEYSQRLVLRRRNVAARAAVSDSTAGALFEGALEGGSAAAGLPLGGLAVGQRADFMVVDADSPALLGIPPDHMLDAVVFSSPEARFRQVFVAGREATVAGFRGPFVQAMRELWT